MIHSWNCLQQATQLCLACNTRICACHGIGNGQCPVCYRGFLTQYYKPMACGYKGCTENAVAKSPRVERACLKHATERGDYTGAEPQRQREYAQHGPYATYTATLLRRLDLEA